MMLVDLKPPDLNLRSAPDHRETPPEVDHDPTWDGEVMSQG
jgi:hypothetical protein